MTPVGLSGLVESRHAGCPGMKLFMLHEQLVCRISVNVLLKYTKVLVPSFVWPCLVASKVQGRFGSLSIGIERMVPLVRPLGNVYVVVTVVADEPVKVRVVPAGRSAPVYLTRKATMPLVHSRVTGGG